MLIDVSRYTESLKKLWIDTFGDSEDYVNLLFYNGYTPTECFAEVISGEVVSVLYLLKGYIKTEKAVFEGRYLYAAATAVNHRGKGLMAKLLKEAQQYIKDNNISFISLVPADEGLYGYYGRFGFESVMKNYVSVNIKSGLDSAPTHSMSNKDFFALRKSLPGSYFNFADEGLNYALSCLHYAGFNLVQNSADSYYIISGDKSEVLEYVSSAENFTENTKVFLNRLSEGTTVVSPHDLSGFCECRENKYGMVYFADEKMKKYISGDVYMNIALD